MFKMELLNKWLYYIKHNKELINIGENYEMKFNNLSNDEQKLVYQIIKEYKEIGYSSTEFLLKHPEYKEYPVDIITFIKDKKYIGNSWWLPNGKCKLFPYWEERLIELFPDNITTSYNTGIITGARGLGKSEIAIACAIYLLYRVMCLKDPLSHFNLKPSETIAFAFMNIKLALVEDIAVSKFHKTLLDSPWFMDRGSVSGTKNKRWTPPSYINLIEGSDSSFIIGQAIFFAFFDEISFIKNMDVDKQKEKAIDMIDTAYGGLMTRFLFKGECPGLVLLASSKRSEKSFLEVHTKKMVEIDSGQLWLIDEPTWTVRPPDEFSGEKFKVALGNKFLMSEVILDEELLPDFIKKGYKILDVPIEYRSKFLEDIDRALCDYAGVSSSELTKYINGARWQSILLPDDKNPFIQTIIECGNNDKTAYFEYFDPTIIGPEYYKKPVFIHIDTSLSNDKTGISAICIEGKTPHIEGIDNARELVFRHLFSVAIKAPKGFQISLAKNRQFIYYLKSKGWNIRGISTDSFQSADTKQALEAKGYKVSIISVDRVKDNVCVPYQFLKNIIYDGKLRALNIDLLNEEITNLERDATNGKIDHSDKGRTGSKDLADSLTGAVYNASLHAEEFAFEYGELLDSTIHVNNPTSMDNHLSVNLENKNKDQLTVLFTDAMKEALNVFKTENTKIQPEKEKEVAKTKEEVKAKSLTHRKGMSEADKELYFKAFSNGIVLF